MTVASDSRISIDETPGPWGLLASMLPTADLSAEAADGDVVPAVNAVRCTPKAEDRRDVQHRIALALYRRA